MTLLDLLSARLPVRRTARTEGGEYHCPCLKCGGVDRFMFWPTAGNFYCRHCGWRGDAITILRDIDGLSFREAAARVGKPIAETDRERATRERVVKDALLLAYSRWGASQLAFWSDASRELAAEIETAEIGYRATTTHANLYTHAEITYWESRLAALYDTLPQVEHRCDLLTYSQYARERWEWWRSEHERQEEVRP